MGGSKIMIVTFEEKENKQYEVQDEHVEAIFENVRNEIDNIVLQYENNSRNIIITILSLNSISKSLMQRLSNDFGADKLIETLKAKEIKSE
jgi:hypothetical protein